MTFRQLELYAAVCECGSITRASEKYHISPQGISKTVGELEKELGCQLLARSVSGISLTNKGSFFYDECRRIIDWQRGIGDRLMRGELAEREDLRLGMAFGVISAVPAGLFTEFEALYPGVRICYSDAPDLDLEEQYCHDAFELCLSTGVMDADRFRQETVASQPMYLCIPRSHPLYLRDSIAMEDLDGQSFAMFSARFFTRQLFDRICRDAGIAPDIEYVSGDFNSLMSLAQRNSLLFAVPAHCVGSLGDQCRYTRFPHEGYVWDICLVTRRQAGLSRSAAAYSDYFRRRMSDWSPYRDAGWPE